MVGQVEVAHKILSQAIGMVGAVEVVPQDNINPHFLHGLDLVAWLQVVLVGVVMVATVETVLHPLYLTKLC
jgi:hypothetical protein